MNLEQITKQVVVTAKEAGTYLLQELEKFSPDKIEHKGTNDLVSYVDKNTEVLIVKQLKEILPEAGFITEEKTVEVEDKEYQWIIDPLDGTTNFIHQLPTFSVSIALFQNKKPIVGVIYEPNQDECFFAWKNGGAFLNDKQIHVKPNDQLQQSLVATGFPYSLLGKGEEYAKLLLAFVDQTHGLRRLGSAAVDMAYVACGRFDAYYEFNVNLWDIAAGLIIVEEAGGKVTDFNDVYSFNNANGLEILAANNVHKEALELISSYWH